MTEMTLAQQADLAFLEWGLRTRRPLEPDCIVCHHPESECTCGYVAFRTLTEWMDALGGDPR